MTKVEEVARVIYDGNGRLDRKRPLDKEPEHLQEHFRSLARAAIGAMREPSPAIVKGCVGELREWAADYEHGDISSPGLVKFIWAAGIDAALAEDAG